MRKIAILITALFAVTSIVFAQDQTVNGNLSVKGLLYLPWATDQDNRSPGLTAVPNDDFLFKSKYINHYGVGFYRRDSESYLRAYISDYFGIDFFTEGKQRLTIARNGNVGIGTENPTGTLHLYAASPVLSMTYPESGSAAIRGNNSVWIMGISGNPGNEDVSLGTQSGEGQRTLTLAAGGAPRLRIKANGNIGIGTINPQSKLEVAGTIRAKEVKIEATGWADYVFDKSYDLPKLSDVEKHINDKQHLPGIPSEKDVMENGVNVVDMQAKLLQKIEELTLYVIGQDKKIEILQKENISIKNELVNLKK